VSDFGQRSAEHESLAAAWGLQRIELHHARKVVMAADRLLDCFNEFDAEAARFCGEHTEALDTALADYRRVCGDARENEEGEG
jgi:hypothetical protein